MDEAVVLIVKAPNQQIEDQTVHCQINWTVKKLKGHLSEVYPSKPVSMLLMTRLQNIIRFFIYHLFHLISINLHLCHSFICI